ncbi:hypothetical protein FLJC2902T_30370 [Flavobacterium limnosediminis JC2902]|uniref:Glycosyltransferase 2-like domain-containing protein n=1 Tax=Flavobacterium limnosediminis JC2902 TaxID=1341181 RepID=V6SGK6_9FLAO|nr:hypothetical protein FLJC2902T_30370 [Flavobacterium limnosediminis JC2902]
MTERLFSELTNLTIDFEILVEDDGGTLFLAENDAINNLPNCHYYHNTGNIGRAGNINRLFGKSKFDSCLLLDCDIFPVKSDFISHYLQAIKEGNNIVFGGIIYETAIPETEKKLRWVYGTKREALPLAIRKKKPYETTLTSNILISKSLFNNTEIFNQDITLYGYEDLVLIEELKRKNISIFHIDNPGFHLNLETSEKFLLKTKEGINNLVFLEQQGILKPDSTKIVRLFSKLKKMRLNNWVGFLFSILKPFLRKNLISNRPSLFLFDCYKIGYFCYLKSK